MQQYSHNRKSPPATCEKNKKHETLFGDFFVCECGTNIGSEVKVGTRKDGSKFDTRKYYCMSKNYEWRDGIKRDCVNKMSLDIDRTDKAVYERIKSVVKDSSLLKEKTKKEGEIVK